MVQAVGAVSAATPVRPAATAAALEAQLDLCQRQLSDHVNCTSAKTPEGKKTIEELASRIGLIKSRIDQLSKPSQANVAIKAAPGENNFHSRLAETDGGLATPNSLQLSGGLIDTFA
ncbi:MAG: hypothetical protein HYS18_07620 [Burkholderiales bacterium]|nr:hypothetical protein [Burkholderiales bacterium]